jgi:hypothetical protein
MTRGSGSLSPCKQPTRLDDQAVVAELNVFRQQLGISRVHYVVVQVGEKGALRLDAFDVFERFVQAEVRRVRFDADAVEDEDVEVLQAVDGGVADEI